MPTGEISPTLENIKVWFDAGVHCAGMGLKLIIKDAVANSHYIQIEEGRMPFVDGNYCRAAKLELNYSTSSKYNFLILTIGPGHICL